MNQEKKEKKERKERKKVIQIESNAVLEDRFWTGY
jgi:hypothetical protein